MSKTLQQRARALAGRTALPTGEVRNFLNILADRLDALEAALTAFVELLDGQTEPLAPLSWAADLEGAKRALAGGPR